MEVRIIILISIITLCGITCQVYGDDNDDADDDCASDIKLDWISYIANSSWNVEWGIKGKKNCSIEYRVLVTDDNKDVLQDVRGEFNSVRLDIVSPCFSYQVNLSAFSSARPDDEQILKTGYIDFAPRPQIAPQIKSVDVQLTSVNITWTLQGDANKCPLKNFYIDGGKYFNITVPMEELKDPATVSTEIKSLLPNSMYYFKCYVENKGGISPATQLAIQTLGT